MYIYIYSQTNTHTHTHTIFTNMFNMRTRARYYNDIIILACTQVVYDSYNDTHTHAYMYVYTVLCMGSISII